MCQLCFPNPEIVLDFNAFSLQIAAEARKPPRLGRGDQERLDNASMTVDEYAEWDALGFTVLQAIELSSGGMPISEAITFVRSGTAPIEVWRTHRTPPDGAASSGGQAR